MATFLVEKEVEGKKVPIPLVIEKAQQKSMEEIAGEIERARQAKLSGKDIVLHRKTSIIESFYYRLPGWFRRMIWRYLLRHPRTAYRQILHLTILIDHDVIDGALMARFVGELAGRL